MAILDLEKKEKGYNNLYNSCLTFHDWLSFVGAFAREELVATS